MGDRTGIEWTDATWNPIRGCTRVSEGCRNCYAEVMASRFCGPGQPYEGVAKDGRWTGEIRVVEKALEQPMRWKRPRRIFVNSMSDLFHEGVSDEVIIKVLNVAIQCPQHVFQVLTKRPERMAGVLQSCSNEVFGKCLSGEPTVSDWPIPNLWLGVSVENQATADERIPLLMQTPAAVRWLSMEPLLGGVDIARWLRCGLCGSNEQHGNEKASGCWHDSRYWARHRLIDWVVLGGESGPGSRPMHPDWARSIRDQCAEAGVAFLFKQWGDWTPAGHPMQPEHLDESRIWSADPDCTMVRLGKKATGRILDGWTHDEYPGEKPAVAGGEG